MICKATPKKEFPSISHTPIDGILLLAINYFANLINAVVNAVTNMVNMPTTKNDNAAKSVAISNGP